MSLLDRFSNLVKADAHGVVDSLEDRRLLLRQSLREAEIELDRKRARLEALGAEEQRLTECRSRMTQRIVALDADVQLALETEQEDLARFSIRKLLPLQAEADHAAARLKEAGEERERVAARLAEQEGELDSLKTRVKAHLARVDEDGKEGDPLTTPIVAEEEVELELLRRRRSAQGGE